MKAKRKAISKKTRFEIFKRDRFTCRYCGKHSPEVILEVDHILPVAEGGSNDLLNLVTSCRGCNQEGCAAARSTAETDLQFDQAGAMADEIEQTEMMAAWYQELREARDRHLKIVVEEFEAATRGRYRITERHLPGIKRLMSRFSLVEIVDATEILAWQFEEGKAPTDYGAASLIRWVAGICKNRREQEGERA